MIREQEDLIRRRDREWAFAWNGKGHLILEKEGERNNIEFDDEEVALINGATLTHNHPSGLLFAENDPRSFGHSFSEDDIRLACLAELVEVRAVTPKLRFSMKPPVLGWSLSLWEDTVEPRYSKYYGEVWQELMTTFSSGRITSAEADAGIMHETWSRVAEELSLTYHREED